MSSSTTHLFLFFSVVLLSIALSDANLSIGKINLMKGPKRSTRSLATGRLFLSKAGKRSMEMETDKFHDLRSLECRIESEKAYRRAEILYKALSEELNKIEECEQRA